jgi:hypothetical protein
VISTQTIDLSTSFLGDSFLVFGRKSTLASFSLSNNPPPIQNGVGVYSKLTSSSLSSGGMKADSVSRSSRMIGDINGDSYPDFAIGDPLSSKVYFYLGDSPSSTVMNRGISFTVTSGASDLFGWSLSPILDGNHDGIDDFMISAINSNIVYVFYGRPVFPTIFDISSSWVSSSGNGFRIIGNANEIINFGMMISSAGDFNHDGFHDYLISGVSMIQSSQNIIYLIFGSISMNQNGNDFHVSNSSCLSSSSSLSSSGVLCVMIVAPQFSFAGFVLSGLGDINGDGYDDIAFGSIPFQGGYSTQRTYVFYGFPITSNSSNPLDLSLFMFDQNDDHGNDWKGFEVIGGGFAVFGVGDVNGDNINDFMIINYQDWQGQWNSYLLIAPRNVTSFPTIAPSFSPSSSPSSQPSSRPLTSSPSSFPTIAIEPSYPPVLLQLNQSLPPTLAPVTRRPTIQRSSRPSFRPSTLIPTTIKPSFKPSITPTARRTVQPTISPSMSVRSLSPLSLSPVRSKIPSRQPTYSFSPTIYPTSYPTLSLSESFDSERINSYGTYQGSYGKTWFIVDTSSNAVGGLIEITGGGGMKVYSIFPWKPSRQQPAPPSSSSSLSIQSNSIKQQTNSTNSFFTNIQVIVIQDFHIHQDIIDLSKFVTTIRAMKDISYSNNPLFLYLNEYQLIKLTDINQFEELSEENFHFGILTDKNSSDLSLLLEGSVQFSLGMLFFLSLIVVICSCSSKDYQKDDEAYQKKFISPPPPPAPAPAPAAPCADKDEQEQSNIIQEPGIRERRPEIDIENPPPPLPLPRSHQQQSVKSVDPPQQQSSSVSRPRSSSSYSSSFSRGKYSAAPSASASSSSSSWNSSADEDIDDDSQFNSFHTSSEEFNYIE